MSDYDYGNARLRAMKSRLLSRRDLESLAEVESLQGLIAALTKTAYRKSVEAALARAIGMDCISDALRNDLIGMMRKVRAFFTEDAGETVAIVLRDFDVHNLKAILRGLAKNVSSGEILSTILPVGELSYDLLIELARAPGPRAAIDYMASMSLPSSQPLLTLRAKRPGADIFEMELALDQWRFVEARQFLERVYQEGDFLFSALKLEADLVNLLTILRFAHVPSERKQLRIRLGTEDPSCLFVEPGFLSWDTLVRAVRQESLESICGALAGSAYGPALNAGLDKFLSSGRLSDFEKQLKRYRLRWMASLIDKDPLGIGVLLGYLALKTNEIGNIRWVARAISSGLRAEAIRAEMEFAV